MADEELQNPEVPRSLGELAVLALAHTVTASIAVDVFDEDQGAAEHASCGCPEKDGTTRHSRSSCTDPIVARLDWHADDEDQAAEDGDHDDCEPTL